MKRKFFDMLIIPNKLDEIPILLGTLSYFGYSGFGIDLERLLKSNKFDLKKLVKIINDISEEFNLLSFILVKENFAHALFRDKYNISNEFFVYEEIKNEKDLRQNLSKKAIEIFFVDFFDLPDTLNMNTINLVKQKEKVIGIKLKKLWLMSPKDLSRNLKRIEKIIPILSRKDLMIIFGSGGSHVNELRNPRFIRSYLRILGIPDKIFLKGFEEIPIHLHKIVKKIIFY